MRESLNDVKGVLVGQQRTPGIFDLTPKVFYYFIFSSNDTETLSSFNSLSIFDELKLRYCHV